MNHPAFAGHLKAHDERQPGKQNPKCFRAYLVKNLGEEVLPKLLLLARIVRVSPSKVRRANLGRNS